MTGLARRLLGKSKCSTFSAQKTKQRNGRDWVLIILF